MRWLLLLLLTVSLIAVAGDRYPFRSVAKQQQFVKLTQQLRCLVCQNENLAASTAPLAADLREKVYRMVLVGKSNAEIKTYFVKRYGNFVLFKPPVNKQTYLLWLLPFLLLLFAVAILIVVIRSNYRVKK